MTTLLIITRSNDSHALAIKKALEADNHAVDLWDLIDFPTRLNYSCSINNTDFSTCISTDNWSAKNHYDVIWYRRPTKPSIPHYLHTKDHIHADTECNALTQSMLHIMYPDAKWINPISAAKKSNLKAYQLKLAVKHGLKIPNTLITNDPQLIKSTLNKGDYIYKTLLPISWINKNELQLSYTSKLSLSDLPSDPVLRCVPGIYQEQLSKKYELRITYFGERYVAVKIDSQLTESAKQDWRAAPTKLLALEQVLLPTPVDKACQALMKDLGIVFGCFDFIVTPDDDHYFLEVNEQGQFLWIEDVNPSIHLLHPFCEFITSL